MYVISRHLLSSTGRLHTKAANNLLPNNGTFYFAGPDLASCDLCVVVVVVAVVVVVVVAVEGTVFLRSLRCCVGRDLFCSGQRPVSFSGVQYKVTPLRRESRT